VLRLAAERASKKVEHWQSVAIAACEQCGGNRVPVVHGVKTLTQWLTGRNPADAGAPTPLLLSLREGTQALRALEPGGRAVLFLSGPEGGLSGAEEAAAVAAGFQPVTLGARVLRAETAALTALALLA
jgi:16S rRNA (uracil1498-N3)-methyltransferase